jgi:hypothetical protein
MAFVKQTTGMAFAKRRAGVPCYRPDLLELFE